MPVLGEPLIESQHDSTYHARVPRPNLEEKGCEAIPG